MYSLRNGCQIDALDVRRTLETTYHNLGILFIVDGTTVISEDPEKLQAALDLIHERFVMYGLVVNVDKTEAISFGGVARRSHAWNADGQMERLGI